MTSHRARRLIQLVAFLALVSLATGCFIRPGKKTGRKSASAGEIVDRKSIILDRIGDGDSARIQFKTHKKAHCKLSFYAKQPGIEPTKDQPRVLGCSEPEKARSEFTELLDKLRTDTLYTIVIQAWPEGGSERSSDIVNVDEAASSSNPNGDGKLSDLWVARFNIPLKAAEIHRHTPGAPLDISSIKEKLTRKLGCQSGIPDRSGPFREAASDVGIRNLATRDFAAANATPHPAYPNRLQLNYASVNDVLEKWSLIFTLNSRDYTISASPMSRILNLEMSSTNTLAFDEPQLSEAVNPLIIDITKPLKISWTVNGNLLESSFVTLQIGRPENDKAVYCVFDAQKRMGIVDQELLKELDDGKHVVLAELVSNQIWLKYGWLITTYDWRSGRIQK